MIYVTSGGGTGCTLVVTGVAGDNVTVSKDGKTYSKTFKDDGTATFKGLKTGTWTVTMTDGASTASRTVTINSDYTLTITYFSATINVTYPKGSTCTATDGTTTLTAPDTSGKWACVVPNAGTWTVKCTNGSQSASSTVSITTEGQVKTVTLAYQLLLFNNGNTYTSTTGGWGSVNGNMGSNVVSNYLRAMYYDGYIYTKNVINLTNYKKLYTTISNAYTTGPDDRGYIYVYNTSSNKVVSSYMVQSGNQTVSLDISAISGSYQIRYTGSHGYFDVTKAWLE